MPYRNYSHSILALPVILSSLVLCGQARAQNQTTSSALNGLVVDSTGAVVSGATVTLTGNENGIVRAFTTTPDGLYSFRLLPPSQYELKVDAHGFKSYRQQGIILTAGQTATQAIELTVGSSTEQVTVTSEVLLLNVDNASLSADISSKK